MTQIYQYTRTITAYESVYTLVVTLYESVYTLVVMALDRYLAIVHPVRSISWRTVRNSAIAILLTWVTSRFTNNLSL